MFDLCIQSDCIRNGFVWSMLVSNPSPRYFYSLSEAYAVTLDEDGDCNATSLLPSVCVDILSDLPPYLCEKETAVSMSAIIGSSIANVEAFRTLLAFGVALFLEWYLSRQRSKRNAERDEEMNEESDCSDFSESDDDNNSEDEYSGALQVSKSRTSSAKMSRKVTPAFH